MNSPKYTRWMGRFEPSGKKISSNNGYQNTAKYRFLYGKKKEGQATDGKLGRRSVSAECISWVYQLSVSAECISWVYQLSVSAECISWVEQVLSILSTDTTGAIHIEAKIHIAFCRALKTRGFGSSKKGDHWMIKKKCAPLNVHP